MSGIGEAALLGAALGGGTSLVTGQDPLKGALMGGLTGGAFSGIGSALGVGADAATKVAGTTANAAPTLANAATQSADTIAQQMISNATTAPVTSGINATLSSAPQIADVAAQTTNTGITGLGGMQPPVAPNVATTFTPAPIGAPTQAEMQLLQQGGQQAAAPAAQGGIRSMFNLKPDSLATKGLDWWDKQDTLTQAGIGGVGLMGADAYMNPDEAPIPEKYKSKLAGYNREEFSPYEPQPVTPYYQARYAQGGIAALANGPQNPQGGMYPQSQQANTQYATPSQMPTSAEVVNSGYEPQTNPYTGEPVGYASGGATVAFPSANSMVNSMMSNPSAPSSPAFGGSSGPGAFFGQPAAMVNNADSGRAQQIGMGSSLDAMGGGKGAMGKLMGQMANNSAANFDPEVFKQGQEAQDAQRAQMGSHVYKPNYAEGGIAGYSLGGYAHGGNPRLLDGPGDGMSDDIPATIDNKQPARLAAGEFVVPADVVSHLGNGSTDAGAKHLYSMMDKVRKARTGNSKQGKQINANKFLSRQG